jgi:pyruvate dehydrogenase E2 component (dihydrolipoamide acetyltransferase)
VKELNVKEGEKIKIGQVILKVESNGAGASPDKKEEKKQITSPEKPVVPEIRKEEKIISESTKPAVASKPSERNVTEEEPSPRSSAPASPSVRRLARELGVEVTLVKGSGNSGRITEDDVKLHVKERMSGTSVSSGAIVQKPLPDFGKWGKVRIEPMSKVRSLTADSMTYAWSTIPMVTQFDKADITSLEDFRKKYSADVEKAGGKLTVTSILTAVCALALKEFPNFNTSIDLSKREIIFKEYCNIGIAVDTDRGLLVPVVKNADVKSITEISVEISDLAEKARSKKITPDEMDGGNFTISNLGGIGGTGFTPIVYSPQVAIMGVSRSAWEPVYLGEKFVPKLMLPLSLTYDHRIIDGAAAARFLRWVCDALENPLSIFL